jgi:Ca-activated chloride channel family protein
VRRLALLAGAALALASARPLSLAAQTPSPSPSPPAVPRIFTFESAVEMVSLTAVVHDKGGKFIRGLGPKDIDVFEDGVRQEVTYFREATDKAAEQKIPLSVVLVLDASGSMRENMHFLQEAALAFVYKLTDVDEALVVQFNESIKGSVEFTGDVGRLEQFVEALQAWGGTSLYDAIHYSLGRIRDQPGRKAIVVFSDGADTTSGMKEQEVVDYARAVEATVYCVGIRGTSGLMARSPRGFLRKIAQETGGSFFFPDRVGDLIKVFNEISDELHNHYALAYSPAKPPDSLWRDIEVRLKRKDAEIRVRKGYFAVKRRPRSSPVPSGGS